MNNEEIITSRKFTDLEKSLISCLSSMINQHCEEHIYDGKKYFFSGYLSANEDAFETLIDLKIMDGNNINATFIRSK